MSRAGRTRSGDVLPELRPRILPSCKTVVVTPKSPRILEDWEFYPPATPAAKGAFELQSRQQHACRDMGAIQMTWDSRRTKYLTPGTGLPNQESTVVRAGFGISYTPFRQQLCLQFPVRANNASISCNLWRGCASSDKRRLQNGFPALFNLWFRRTAYH